MEVATLAVSLVALAVAAVALYASSFAPAEVQMAFLKERSGIPVREWEEVPRLDLSSSFHLYAYAVNVGAQGAALVDVSVTGFGFRGDGPAVWTRAEPVNVSQVPRPRSPPHFLFPLPLPAGEVQSLMLVGNLRREPPIDDLEAARAVGGVEGFKLHVEWKVAKRVGLPLAWRWLPARIRGRHETVVDDAWVDVDTGKNKEAVLAWYREHGRQDLLEAAGVA